MTEQALLCVDCMTVDPCEVGADVLGTDPPYAPRVHEGMASCAAHGKRKGVRQRDAGFAPLSPELRAYLAAASRAAKRWTLIYSDLEGVGAWAAVLPRFVRTVPVVDTEDAPLGSLPWLRWSMPQLSGDRPTQGAEAVVLAHAVGGRMHWGGPGNLVALAHACERGMGKHPTAKPLDQALDLMAWFSDPGELWFDPCAGRGTFGVAAAILGRDYLGCETNEQEAGLGAARIREAQAGRLSPRDLERYRRWAKSIGYPDEPPEAMAGLSFRKGLPWAPEPEPERPLAPVEEPEDEPEGLADPGLAGWD